MTKNCSILRFEHAIVAVLHSFLIRTMNLNTQILIAAIAGVGFCLFLPSAAARNSGSRAGCFPPGACRRTATQRRPMPIPKVSSLQGCRIRLISDIKLIKKRGFRKERRPDNRPACESRNPKRSLRGYFGAVTNGVSSSFFSVAG